MGLQVQMVPVSAESNADVLAYICCIISQQSPDIAYVCIYMSCTISIGNQSIQIWHLDRAGLQPVNVYFMHGCHLPSSACAAQSAQS